MLVMVVFFIAFRWIHLSTPLIRLFLLVLILLLMPTLNFLPVWFALSLLRFRLPSRLPMMFILWIDRKSGSAGMPRPISYAVFCLKKKKQPITAPSTKSRDRRGKYNASAVLRPLRANRIGRRPTYG